MWLNYPRHGQIPILNYFIHNFETSFRAKFSSFYLIITFRRVYANWEKSSQIMFLMYLYHCHLKKKKLFCMHAPLGWVNVRSRWDRGVDITGSLKFTDTFLLITAPVMHRLIGKNMGWSVIKRIFMWIVFFSCNNFLQHVL